MSAYCGTRPIDRIWQKRRKGERMEKFVNAYEKSKFICNKLTIGDRAYLAGIIDGEGCISCFSYSGKHRAIVKRIDIANTNHILMDWIILKIPFFSVRIKNSSKYHINAKPCYHAVLDRTTCILPLLESIYPFMVLKRTQAEMMMALCRRRWNGNHYLTQKDFDMADSFRNLNKKGLKP